MQEVHYPFDRRGPEYKEVVVIVGYECPECGRPSLPPEEVGHRGIGWHENAEYGGYSCRGVGLTPRPITVAYRVPNLFQ